MNDQWQEFCTTLQSVGNELIAAAPDEPTRAEGIAYLARLAAYGVERHMMGAERLTNGIDFNSCRIGGYNPDYRVGTATVQSGRRYRIRGQINHADRVVLAVYSMAADGTIPTDDFIVLVAGSPMLSAGGGFDIEIGPDVASGKGLRTRATTNLFVVREILLKRGGQHADLTLLSEEAIGSSDDFSVERSAQSIISAQNFFTGSMRQFLTWSNHFASLPNTMEPLLEEFDSKLHGAPGTVYYTGYFNLRADQALIVEVPNMTADYWGVMLANHWQEPLPTSFINHLTAQKERDGVTRIVISMRDPGQANWLPTGGRTRGVIWHRTINASVRETPRCSLR